VIVQPGEFGRVCIFTNQGLDLAADVTGFASVRTAATSVGMGRNSACSTRSDGTVWCWGRINPNFTIIASLSQVGSEARPVVGLSNGTDVDAASNHACAVHDGGSVSCWGENESGQLGDGTFGESLEPVKVLGIEDAVSIEPSHDAARATGRRGPLRRRRRRRG